MKIAIIITAFNRKEKTLSCLRRLKSCVHPEIDYQIYLTDDGSTDGTSEAVSNEFPEVKISQGDGNLYWSGGTNLSWKRAVEEDQYDGYLWLNDDTLMLPHFWNELIDADSYCKKKFNKGGIYAGATTSLNGKYLTYGASVNTKKWRSLFRMLEPNGQFQECDVANGNITFISKDVVDEIGCLHPGYAHGGDYDYTYWAHKEGFPILLTRSYVGRCDNDHHSSREILSKKNIKERIRYLYSPTGFQLKTALLFQKRFFPHYVPILFVSYWAKALFPWILKK